MAELQLLPSLVLFLSGLIVGVLAILLFNKLKTGSVSANSVKKEKEAYQAEVEAHFEETSQKFKAMAEQYQDLYQHLSVGATTLCRPDKMAPGLQNQDEVLKLDTETNQDSSLETKNKVSDSKSEDEGEEAASNSDNAHNDQESSEEGSKANPKGSGSASAERKPMDKDDESLSDSSQPKDTKKEESPSSKAS